MPYKSVMCQLINSTKYLIGDTQLANVLANGAWISDYYALCICQSGLYDIIYLWL